MLALLIFFIIYFFIIAVLFRERLNAQSERLDDHFRWIQEQNKQIWEIRWPTDNRPAEHVKEKE